MSDPVEPMFSPLVITKATRIVEDGFIEQDAQHSEVWWVRSRPSQAKPYRVQIAPDRSWATCTCAHGLNHAGTPTCSHLAAALMKIEEAER